MSDIFREIEDELRRDNLLKLWSRYGKYIIAAVVLAVVVAGAIVAWREHQADQRRAQGARYSEALALARAGKSTEAANEFSALAQQGGGYGVPAAFERAELLAHNGDGKGAAAIYDRIAGDANVDPEFRGLATVLSVSHALSGNDADPKAAIARLEPLTASGNPWRTSALELTAAAKLAAGDRAAALAIYQKLADDLAAPQALRARAAELAAALKS